MKKLLLLILPLTAFSEEYNAEESHEEVPHVIVRLLESIQLPDNDIAWTECHEQYSQNANLIRQKFLLPYLEYQNKIIENKKVLLDLEFKIKKQELEKAEKMKKIQNEIDEREMIIAESYNKSSICKIDGRSWYELSPLERKKHRDIYVKSFRE